MNLSAKKLYVIEVQ